MTDPTLPPPPPPLDWQQAPKPVQGVLPPGITPAVYPINEDRPKLPAIQIGDNYYLYHYEIVMKSGRHFSANSDKSLPEIIEQSKNEFLEFHKWFVVLAEIEAIQVTLKPVAEESLTESQPL